MNMVMALAELVDGDICLDLYGERTWVTLKKVHDDHIEVAHTIDNSYTISLIPFKDLRVVSYDSKPDE